MLTKLNKIQHMQKHKHIHVIHWLIPHFRSGIPAGYVDHAGKKKYKSRSSTDIDKHKLQKTSMFKTLQRNPPPPTLSRAPAGDQGPTVDKRR
jgi:hypothetical protein